MIVLGIDPGLNRMGYGLIEVNREVPKAIDFGIIKTSPDEKLHIPTAKKVTKCMAAAVSVAIR